MDEEILLERIIVCSIRVQYRSVGICEAEAVSLSSDEARLVNRKLVLVRGRSRVVRPVAMIQNVDGSIPGTIL